MNEALCKMKTDKVMIGKSADISFLNSVYAILILVIMFGSALESIARESTFQGAAKSSVLNADVPTEISGQNLTSDFSTEPAQLPDISLEEGERVRLHLKNQIDLLLLPPDSSVMSEYFALDSNLRQKFNTKRLGMLRALAGILAKGHLVFGLQGFVKGKYLQIRNKVLPGKAGDALAGPSPPSAKPSVAEIGLAKVKDIVGAANNFLLSQVNLLIESNEVGFVMGFAPILEAGAVKWGYGGAPLSVYISVGYSSSENAYVFDIARGNEYFESALSAFVIGGLNIQTGIYLLSSKEGREHLPRAGTTFYPPVAPLYIKVTKSGDYASAGMSTTFPPVGGDLFTWTNIGTQVSLVRVKFSKLIPGFVRWTWGGLPNLGVVRQKVSNVVAELKSRSQIWDRLKNSSPSTSSGLCREAVVGGRFADIQ